jgi:YjbE family integral membrane protein
VLPELSPEFFVALMGIVLADLVLAGDNAVVIALASRNLPPEQRRKAVVFGATLAIMLRAALTVAAVFLLRGDIPFVMLIGGVLLLWIGWKLAVEDEADHEGLDAATTMRGAVGTILMADIVMSIDNVLAVAAFARDDAWLVVFGLIISIPVIMGGAALLLRVIDRFPIIVWIGSALIIYVGVELILKDPVLHDHLPAWLESSWVHRGVGAAIAVTVTSIAWYVRTHDDRSGGVGKPPRAAGATPRATDAQARLMVEGSATDA